MDWLVDAFNWTIPVAGGGLLMREVLGNVFGLASALGGMARRVWAWPVGILGNLILLTVFLASLFTGADHATLLGQAGRQVMFIAVSVYGWVRWRQARRGHAEDAPAITPEWAGWGGRTFLALPTDDEVPGGTFVQWFRLTRDPQYLLWQLRARRV